jgi:hypothetical protein
MRIRTALGVALVSLAAMATAFQAGPDGDERAGAMAVIVVDTGTAADGAGPGVRVTGWECT